MLLSIMQPRLSEGTVLTVLCSAIIWTGWSVNWTVWRPPQVHSSLPSHIIGMTSYSLVLNLNSFTLCYFLFAGILEVLYCILIESPEVLNIIQENHIKSIISLLDKHGRNHKVH